MATIAQHRASTGLQAIAGLVEDHLNRWATEVDRLNARAEVDAEGREYLVQKIDRLTTALETILARINGEWDHAGLLAYGVLGLTDSDVSEIATTALKASKKGVGG